MQGYFKRSSVSFLLIFVLAMNTMGQPGDAVTTDKTSDADSSYFRLRNQLVPLGLISGGLLIESIGAKKEIQTWFPGTNTRADNYLQYAPIGILYLTDAIGTRHRNNIFNQTKFLIISEAATGLLTQVIKKITNVTRPNGGTLSFPSGHTSNAFTSATVLYKETIDYDPLLAYSGYLFSTSTAVLRITNNRHWISDVLVGAGLGILVTNLVYYLEPLKSWDPFKLNGKAQLIPDIDPSTNTYYLSIRIGLN